MVWIYLGCFNFSNPILYSCKLSPVHSSWNWRKGFVRSRRSTDILHAKQRPVGLEHCITAGGRVCDVGRCYCSRFHWLQVLRCLYAVGNYSVVLGLLLLVVHSSFCLQSTDNDGQIWLRLKVTPLRRSLWLSVAKKTSAQSTSCLLLSKNRMRRTWRRSEGARRISRKVRLSSGWASKSVIDDLNSCNWSMYLIWMCIGVGWSCCPPSI